IQQAGVVLSSNLGAAYAFSDRMHDDPGYAGMLTTARECSAVSATCLLTRKEDYLAVGGMDELFFPMNFNDVDYCLKLRALGKRILVTTYARLLCRKSLKQDDAAEGYDRALRPSPELRTLR